jgi:creatinine amidohydrolase/Fe(II)-dependent formamide hydrolase-like protein
LNNDAIISAGLTRELSARLRENHPDWPSLSAGEIPIGVDTCPGPGSRPIHYPAACRIIEQACRSLADLGAQRVLLMTFHGTPLHNLAIHRGVKLLERLGVRVFAPLNIALRYLIEGNAAPISSAYAHVTDAREREAMIERASLDFHGGFLETSLTLHYAPETVGDYRSLPPCPELLPVKSFRTVSRMMTFLGRRQAAAEFMLLAGGLAWYQLRPFPAYTGSPHLARAESGAIIARWIGEKFLEQAEMVFAGHARAPGPVMPWMPLVTLGGFLGRIEIPEQMIVSSPAQS